MTKIEVATEGKEPDIYWKSIARSVQSEFPNDEIPQNLVNPLKEWTSIRRKMQRKIISDEEADELREAFTEAYNELFKCSLFGKVLGVITEKISVAK